MIPSSPSTFFFNSDSGSSSSASGSGDRSGSDKSSAGDRSHHSDDTRSSQKHSNPNSSKSDHPTDKDSSGEDGHKFKSRNNHGKVTSDIWEDNPDIYGIRRSGRSRKEPDRLKIVDSDSSDRGKSNRRKNRKKRYIWQLPKVIKPFLTSISNDFNSFLIFSDSWNSDTSDSDSDLKGSPPPPSKRPGQRSVPLRKRKPTRRRRFTSDEEESSEGSDEDTKR